MLSLFFLSVLWGVTLGLSDSRQGVALKSLQAEHWKQWKNSHKKLYT